MSERLSSQVILSISRRTEETNYCLWESQRSDQVIVMFCPHWAVWPQLHIAIGDKTDSDQLRRISKFGGKTDWDLFCGSPVIGAPVLLKRLTYNCQTTITVQQRWGKRCWKKKTLPTEQRTQGIEYFDSFNTFSSKQKLQQALKSWSNFSLVLFGKGREIQLTTLTDPCNNQNKSI